MALPIQKADSLVDEKEICRLVAESFTVNEPFASIFRDTDKAELMEKATLLVGPRMHGRGKETFKIADPETKYVHLPSSSFGPYLEAESLELTDGLIQ